MPFYVLINNGTLFNILEQPSRNTLKTVGWFVLTGVAMNNNKSNGFNDIAIVGMGALFAGAKNIGEYWNNILNKVDSIQDIPTEFWDFEDHYDVNPFAVDKSYCKKGGFLPPIAFDPLGFGIPPNVLESISLNQLLSLQVAKDTLVDAKMLGKNAMP